MTANSFDTWVLENIKPEKLKILDAGCGFPQKGKKNAGHTVKALLKAGYDAYGVDIDENVSKLNASVNNTDNNERFICADMTKYIKANAPFDVITSCYALNDLSAQRLKTFLKTAHNSLTQGGRLFIEFNFEKTPEDIHNMLHEAGFKTLIRFKSVMDKNKIKAERYIAVA